MNKNYLKFLHNLFLLFTFTLLFYACENREDQTNNLSQNSKTEEYEKIEIKMGAKTEKISLNYKVYPQLKDERNFIDIQTKRIFKIGGIKDTALFAATQIRSDNSGNIYALDMGGYSVKKFNSEGVLIRKYGRKGRGPGEFVSPFRIDVINDGKLLVLDINLTKCEIFENDKSKQFLLSSMPVGACFIDSTSFATLQVMNPFDYSSIKKYNIIDGSSEECQNFIKVNDNLNLGMLTFLQGDILSADDKNFIYVPMYMNHFVKYSQDGKIIYARNTIEDIQLPSIGTNDSRITDFRLPDEYRSSLFAFTGNHKLYNVSYQAIKRKATSTDFTIDVYNLSDGKYEYSFILPDKKKLLYIYMDKEKLYLLNNEQELEVFTYKIEE